MKVMLQVHSVQLGKNSDTQEEFMSALAHVYLDKDGSFVLGRGLKNDAGLPLVDVATSSVSATVRLPGYEIVKPTEAPEETEKATFWSRNVCPGFTLRHIDTGTELHLEFGKVYELDGARATWNRRQNTNAQGVTRDYDTVVITPESFTAGLAWAPAKSGIKSSLAA